MLVFSCRSARRASCLRGVAAVSGRGLPGHCSGRSSAVTAAGQGGVPAPTPPELSAPPPGAGAAWTYGRSAAPPQPGRRLPTGLGRPVGARPGSLEGVLLQDWGALSGRGRAPRCRKDRPQGSARPRIRSPCGLGWRLVGPGPGCCDGICTGCRYITGEAINLSAGSVVLLRQCCLRCTGTVSCV